MATEWIKLGTDLVPGAAAGALDQVLQNQDDKREDDRHKTGMLAAGKKLPILSSFGTYYNYGVALLGTIGLGVGWLKGDMATRVLSIGGTLAGRQGTHRATVKARAVPSAWTVWERLNQPGGPGAENPPGSTPSVLEF